MNVYIKSVAKYKFLTLALIAVSVLAISLIMTRKENLADVAVITSKVSAHIILPTDEKPALITITDRSKVKADFLQVSKTDDKILVYEKHQIAVIYRPSIDRIVDIARVTIGDPADDAPRAAWPEKLP